MAGGIRWAFCWEKWHPSKEEWELGLRCIQPEEVNRIQKFVFQKDAKASLIGRLMLRKAIHDELKIPWTDIKLLRTEKGRPFLAAPADVPGADNYNVNVSHHGDYTVLASSKACQIGVDVMKTEWPRSNESVDKYFSLMNRQFTPHEWQTIRRPDDEWDQLCLFHRHWCLKESYVKALGVGIGFNLQRIDFRIYSELERGHYTTDTRVYVDDVALEQWRFEETLLDDRHCVATALCIEDGTHFTGDVTSFTLPTFAQLTGDVAEPLGHVISSEAYADFSAKRERPGTRNNSVV